MLAGGGRAPGAFSAEPALARVADTLRLQVTWQASALYAVGFGGFVAFSVYLPVYLKNAYLLSPDIAATKMAGFVLLAVIMRRLLEARQVQYQLEVRAKRGKQGPGPEVQREPQRRHPEHDVMAPSGLPAARLAPPGCCRRHVIHLRLALVNNWFIQPRSRRYRWCRD
jgi:hypothetical protein